LSVSDWLFITFGVVCAGSALYAVLTRYLLRSIVALGAFLTAVAGEFYLLAADFVAVVQIFVYVGGIVVLMLFALMLSTSGVRHPLARADRPALGSVLAYGLGGGLIWATVASDIAEPASPPADSVPLLGSAFLGEQLFAFELMGIILLAAVVAALTLVRRERL
jgi:NADH:ubiquinone oxidoreductase subunit 6 (subunit J)